MQQICWSFAGELRTIFENLEDDLEENLADYAGNDPTLVADSSDSGHKEETIVTVYDMDDQTWLAPEKNGSGVRHFSTQGFSLTLRPEVQKFVLPAWAYQEAFLGLTLEAHQALVDTGAQHGEVGK